MLDSQDAPVVSPLVGRRAVLGVLGIAGIGVLAPSLTGCSASPRSGSSTGPTTAPTVPADALDVRRFGARGDGHTDDTRSVVAALRALHPGQTLVFPRGTYRHSQVVTVDTHGVTLQGPGTLLASAEQTSALRIDAPSVTLRDLTVAMGPTTQRWSSDDQQKIFLGPHPGIRVDNVLVDGSAAGGLFSYGAHHFHFHNVHVRDTRADGIHMTNGSRYGLVHHPHVARTGDDGVAVVSYLEDPQPCHDITVISPRVETTTGGRGISVVGGHDVTYRDITVRGSNAAAVYIACEGGGFITHDTERVTVRGGVVTDANTNSTIDHGALLVYCGREGGAVRDVLIADLTVSGTRSSASRQIGVVADSPADLVSDIEFSHLQLAATPTPYEGDAPVADVRLVAVRAAGTADPVTP